MASISIAFACGASIEVVIRRNADVVRSVVDAKCPSHWPNDCPLAKPRVVHHRSAP